MTEEQYRRYIIAGVIVAIIVIGLAVWGYYAS